MRMRWCCSASKNPFEATVEARTASIGNEEEENEERLQNLNEIDSSGSSAADLTYDQPITTTTAATSSAELDTVAPRSGQLRDAFGGDLQYVEEADFTKGRLISPVLLQYSRPN